MRIQFSLISLLIVAIYCVPIEDQVYMPIQGYHQHKWYSGYINFDMGKYHYIFFQSQRDPDNDPVVLWLGGGPGCSAFIGMLYQNGPFVFKEGTQTLQINQYSRNKKANILYLQSPGGVGFSFSFRNNSYNDGTVGQDNLKALIEFFNVKFPNLKKNDFYLSGQSYAGIYVPYLALNIIKYNKLENKKISFNLKGILIGNGCTDPRQCYEPGSDDYLSIYQYQFLYQHVFYTQTQFDSMKAYCLIEYHSQSCQMIRKILDKKFAANKVSLQNIYLKCFSQPQSNFLLNQQNDSHSNLQSNSNSNQQQSNLHLNQQKNLTSNQQSCFLRNQSGFPDCDDQIGINSFFHQPLIHKYLHVDQIQYLMCGSEVKSKYQMFSNASYWIYPLLIKQKIRIWIYSGDFDASVPIIGTLIWIKRLRDQCNIPIQKPWREWWVQGLQKNDDQVGGMTWQLRGFTFASIKAAGHMAPKDNKKSAAVIFDSFINGIELPFKSEQ